MAEPSKVLRVWAHKIDVDDLARGIPDRVVEVPIRDLDVHPSDRPHLLLPIEDGALRVGKYLFRWGRHATPEWRHVGDPEDEWYADGPDMLWDLLMDAVEGVEP